MPMDEQTRQQLESIIENKFNEFVDGMLVNTQTLLEVISTLHYLSTKNKLINYDRHDEKNIITKELDEVDGLDDEHDDFIFNLVEFLKADRDDKEATIIIDGVTFNARAVKQCVERHLSEKMTELERTNTFIRGRFDAMAATIRAGKKTLDNTALTGQTSDASTAAQSGQASNTSASTSTGQASGSHAPSPSDLAGDAYGDLHLVDAAAEAAGFTPGPGQVAPQPTSEPPPYGGTGALAYPVTESHHSGFAPAAARQRTPSGNYMHMTGGSGDYSPFVTPSGTPILARRGTGDLGPIAEGGNYHDVSEVELEIRRLKAMKSQMEYAEAQEAFKQLQQQRRLTGNPALGALGRPPSGIGANGQRMSIEQFKGSRPQTASGYGSMPSLESTLAARILEAAAKEAAEKKEAPAKETAAEPVPPALARLSTASGVSVRSEGSDYGTLPDDNAPPPGLTPSAQSSKSSQASTLQSGSDEIPPPLSAAQTVKKEPPVLDDTPVSPRHKPLPPPPAAPRARATSFQRQQTEGAETHPTPAPHTAFNPLVDGAIAGRPNSTFFTAAPVCDSDDECGLRPEELGPQLTENFCGIDVDGALDILVIGIKGAGKTSLINRFMELYNQEKDETKLVEQKIKANSNQSVSCLIEYTDNTKQYAKATIYDAPLSERRLQAISHDQNTRRNARGKIAVMLVVDVAKPHPEKQILRQLKALNSQLKPKTKEECHYTVFLILSNADFIRRYSHALQPVVDKIRATYDNTIVQGFKIRLPVFTEIGFSEAANGESISPYNILTAFKNTCAAFMEDKVARDQLLKEKSQRNPTLLRRLIGKR